MNLLKRDPAFGTYALGLTAVLLLVAGIEQGTTWLFGALTLAPPLSIIAMGVLAAFFSWRKVLMSLPFFISLSYFLILGTARFPFVRALSVFFAGILASWAAYQRVKLVLHAREIEAILANLDLPWVLSDESGNVCQISTPAIRLLSLNAESTLGASYFSIFSPEEGKGELIRRYLDLFLPSSPPIHAALSVKASGQKIKATLAPLEFSGGKRVLTTLALV